MARRITSDLASSHVLVYMILIFYIVKVSEGNRLNILLLHFCVSLDPRPLPILTDVVAPLTRDLSHIVEGWAKSEME